MEIQERVEHHQLPLTRLLQVLDIYPLRLPIKGGFTLARWTRVILTSNIHPRDWYPNCQPESRRALLRRIHRVTEMLIPWQPEPSSPQLPELHVLNAGELWSPVIVSSPPSVRILRRALMTSPSTPMENPLMRNAQPQNEEEWAEYSKQIVSFLSDDQ